MVEMRCVLAPVEAGQAQCARCGADVLLTAGLAVQAADGRPLCRGCAAQHAPDLAALAAPAQARRFVAGSSGADLRGKSEALVHVAYPRTFERPPLLVVGVVTPWTCPPRPGYVRGTMADGKPVPPGGRPDKVEDVPAEPAPPEAPELGWNIRSVTAQGFTMCLRTRSGEPSPYAASWCWLALEVA